MTDRTHPDSGRIITSSDILLHDAETALMYEELRAAIDDGHESMTHADALAEVAAMRAENIKLRDQLEAVGAGGVSGPLVGIAAPPTAQAEGWQSIETAPKEGVFLVFMQDEVRPARRMQVANWHPNVKIVGGLFAFDCAKVTHWMPLPNPPTSAEGVQALSAAPADIAKLRHLYQNMVNGAVRDTASAKRIAEGLLAPAIEALERATPPAEQQVASSAVLKAIHEANMQLVRTGDDAFMLVPYKVATVEQQAAPKTAPGVGDSGFDHKTAADLLNNKTVSDEAVRKFVAASRWAHDERAALSATLLAMHGVLTSREAEIALLKKALMEAEAAPRQEAQEPCGWTTGITWRPDTRLQSEQVIKITRDTQPKYGYTTPIYTAPQPAPAPLSECLRLLNSFEYEGDEDSQAKAFFKAHINEDWFFHVKNSLELALAAQGGKDA